MIDAYRSSAARDWDAEFANMAFVPGADALPDRWATDAATYRERVAVEEVAYGDGPRERLDLIRPEGPPRGLAVFVHGGYWMKFDKSLWTHFAEGARVRSWAVALPSYPLAPEVRIRDITQAIGRAVARAVALADGPIRLAGHSAGGHLVARMICADTPLPAEVRERIGHTLSISGLHDLAPLRNAALNETLRLDEAEARAESAVVHDPLPGTRLTAWVGGGERPEFLRQSRLLALAWGGREADAACMVDGSHDHFSVIEGLRDPDSPITNAFVG
ncbi:alpha/beta hydrolase [Jannaschia aquimarina]|uniref:Alpha/beta hydrolase family protein n=1 Tax=Jannaschia aquimarina TaxID=935700 RepID=A0A0D1DA73_9RHOB|nr:alpha/beta hydrolase [Jannaschia aquimarina]KIT16783.1 Alpha/beta hydrolase family protein [Jannaschia aquimarina]SNS52471.1 Alpha/beta hydrolase family protein [Jannaschia aquimarina]